MINVARVGRYVQGFRSRPLGLALLATAITTLSWGSNSALAGYDVSGGSSGVVISSSLAINPLANASLSLNALQNTAPSPYNQSLTNTLGGTFSAGAYNLPILGTPEVLLSGSTGFLNSSASSNINGVSVFGSATGATTIDNLRLNVLSTLLVPVLSINATTLTTSSTASGTYNALTATGTPTLVGLSIDVLGIDVTALVEASAGLLVDVSALTGLTGLKIGVDVVTVSGDGILNKSVTTDNIVVQFNNVLSLGGTINGGLAIGESTASITASPVPEPASMAMMGMGLVMLGAFGVRQHRIKRRLVVA